MTSISKSESDIRLVRLRKDACKTARKGRNRMRGYRDIYNMTDREIRIYKRQLRRRILNRRRLFATLLTLCLIGILAVSFYSFKSSADSGEKKFKYYTSIEVEYGQTLWDIHQKYMDSEQYDSPDDYIAELQSINHLNKKGDIRVGQILIVPYFSTEYKN